jgi:hypothetical protein
MTKPTKTLPKNFWDTVEKYLPNYHSRQDVADNNDLVTKSHAYLGDKRTLNQLDKSNRKLYEEALMAKKESKGLTKEIGKVKKILEAKAKEPATRTIVFLVRDDNGDTDALVLRLTHKDEGVFHGGLRAPLDKARKAYGKSNGDLTREDHIEVHLKKAGFKVEHPLGHYTTLEA